MTELALLEAFVDSLGLEYFSWAGDRLERLVTQSGNSTPPDSIQQNIVPVFRLADILRRSAGRPVRINSWYRTPTFNQILVEQRRSSATSCHVHNCALDLSLPAGNQEALWNAAKAAYFDRVPVMLDLWMPRPLPLVHSREFWPLKATIPWMGGLGLYDWGVHIDFRGVQTLFDRRT